MRKKVLVAMSGGVDSSVAAFLLKKSRFDVTGITMCLGIKTQDAKRPRCCGSQAIEDAARVCGKLGIAHYVMDFSKELENKIIKKFVSEYIKGRTPNPCVDCNKYLKFGLLFEKARALDFDYLATGHYAKIERDKTGFVLKRALDKKKDQAYFLYPIKKDKLKYIIFPLADLTKEEVREIARKARLPVAFKPQSQDICFITKKDYRTFLLERTEKLAHGPIFDLRGNRLGEHKGVFSYTIGQRGGLGIGAKAPLYVISINAKKNQVVVGEKKDLKTKSLIARDVNILADDLPRSAFAKIRYNHEEAECVIKAQDEKFKITFKNGQEAVTPGQSIVFYDEDRVLGGGVIEEVLREC